MNNSSISGFAVLTWSVNILNSIVENIGGIIRNFNLICIVILTLLWSVCIIHQLNKEHKNYKIVLKSQSSLPAYICQNKLRNYLTKITIQQFLLAICLNECVYVLTILISDDADRYISLSDNSTLIVKSFVDFIEIQYRFRTGFVFYHSLNNISLRAVNTLITILLYSLFSLIRILIQFLVHRYSYYQYEFKLKLKLYTLLWFIIVLSFLGLFRPLVLLHYLVIVLAVIYEFIKMLVGNRKLGSLLKQRLDDAIKHENHSKSVVLCYQTVYREHKHFSTILLIAFSFQTISFTIYFIAYPDTLYTLFIYGLKEDMHINLKSHPVGLVLNSLVCTVEQALFIITTSLQILPSIMVLGVRIYHKMSKMRKAKSEPSYYNSTVKCGIERNQAAYAQLNY